MKMKTKTILPLAMAVIGAGAVLSGCGSDSGTTSTSDSTTTTDTSSSTTETTETTVTEEEKQEIVELSMLIDSDISLAGFNAVAELAEEKLGIKINIELRPGGDDGDNVVKTRLASGSMADICGYNTGSLLQALNPAEYFVDISSFAFSDRLDDTFKEAVTVGNETYGVPVSSTQAGAVLYDKQMYAQYGLEVPKTWDEFLANCDVLQAAGETAIIGSFGDSWTSQVLYLGDHYNVQSAEPNFAQDFEAGTAKYATTPIGLRSFEKLEATNQYYNSDYLATTYDDACDMIVNGEGGHWIILTQALSNIYELYGEEVNNIGVFAIPGDDASDHGLTVWMPTALYANKDSDNIDDIMRFFEFYISDEALDAYTAVVLPDGPYAVKGYELPENSYAGVLEMQEYFDTGKTAVALEFETAVKGPNCAAITQECGSGQTTALQAADAYDQDCKKQALQLGLDW